jgi:hypothetical protein
MKFRLWAHKPYPILRIIYFFLVLIINSPLTKADTLNDIKIYSHSERTILHSIDSGYTTYVTIIGACYGNSMFIPVVFDPKNQVLTDFSIFFLKKNKYKRQTDFTLLESPDVYSFYRSHVVKMVHFEEAVNFKCTYQLECKTMMLFNGINLCSFYKTDTASYLVSIPQNLSIRYDTVNFDSLSFHKITYYSQKDSHYLSVKVKPYRIDPTKESQRIPFIRQIIVPSNQVNHEEKYFNDWYLNMLDSLSVLDSRSKAIIDSLAIRNPLSKDLVSLYYDYIRLHFKYLDIQIGMGAYIPRNVNTVLKNKQGDCKDLANLLSAILRYKGYNANLAICATLMHFCDFTFPSLVSGDHVICTIKTDSLYILLDPTDVNHIIGQPVQSLQGNTIFITGKNGPLYYKVPILESANNQFKINLNLTFQNNCLDGDFKVLLSGYTGNDLKWAVINQSQNDVHQLFKSQLQEIFHNTSVDDFWWNIESDTVIIQGKLKYYNKCYLSGKQGYLYLDFLPDILQKDLSAAKVSEKILIGYTMQKTFHMVINFRDAIMNADYLPFKEISDSYDYELDVCRLNNKSLSVNYYFDYNKIWIDKNDSENLNNLIKRINNKSHETIILHL